ncbi:MAG: hypothetical protein JWO71_4116 [Candidatus Acidoferrum typicum]|nr:hypothetical protein [Candidatus Acidoferrum typicum]
MRDTGFVQPAQHGGVMQIAPGIFAAADGRMQRLFRNRQPYFGDVARLRSLQLSNLHLQVLMVARIGLYECDRDGCRRLCNSTGDGSVGVTFVAANKPRGPPVLVCKCYESQIQRRRPADAASIGLMKKDRPSPDGPNNRRALQEL